MELVEVREKIRAIIGEILEVEQEGEGNTTEIGDNDSLIEGGLFDSVSALRLIDACQTRFDVLIYPAELSVENFDNIMKISQFVLSKIKEREE
jgi:acyl carrier protein